MALMISSSSYVMPRGRTRTRHKLEVSYPPHHHWRSSVHPDSSLSPWGRSVWSSPALSAQGGLSPGGRSAGSGFAAWGMGSCPQRRCSSASWRKRKNMVVSVWDGSACSVVCRCTEMTLFILYVIKWILLYFYKNCEWTDPDLLLLW